MGNSDNITLELLLKASEWSEDTPYTQILNVEGLNENSIGSIGISKSATQEQIQACMDAKLMLIKQEKGQLTIAVLSDMKPEIDIPVILIYNNN